MDYQTEQGLVTRQRRLADMLRLQAEEGSAYEDVPGRMVSGRFVGPNWSQQIASYIKPILLRQRAKEAEARALSQEQQYGDRVNQARDQWSAGLPQTIPGRPELPGPQAEGGSPELAAVPNQLPSRESVLRQTIAGMRIPGNEKSAELWNRGMGEEVAREDRQTEARNILAAHEAFKREQARMADQLARDQMTDRVEQQGFGRAETQRHNVAMEHLAGQMNDIRATAGGAKSAAEARAEAVEARDIQRQVEKFTANMKSVGSTVSAAQQVQDLLDVYRDPATGKQKSIPGIGRETMLPGWARSVGQQAGVLNPATNPNAAVVQRLLGDIMRQQAGLSQTISEQARVILTNLASGSYTQKEFIDNWGALVNAINNDLTNIKAGPSPEALEIYEQRGGKIKPIVSKFDRPLTAAEQEAARQAERVDPMTAKRARLEELKRKAAEAAPTGSF